MTRGGALAIGAAVVVVGGALALVLTARAREQERRTSSPKFPHEPPDPKGPRIVWGPYTGLPASLPGGPVWM